MAVSISICNLALGDIRAPAISDINEDTIEAAMCSRYYEHCLNMLLDDYTWQFTKRIASLALLTTNERSEEWAYCYALPADCAQALRLIPTGVYSPFYREWDGMLQLPIQTLLSSFIVEDGKLYCQVADAKLEYASNAAEEADFPPLFREALRKLLAANLAVPIRDSRELEGDLLKMAEQARQAAIANDMNRAPRTEMTDDVAWARRG